MEPEEFSRVIGRILGSTSVTPEERDKINNAMGEADSIEEMPADVQELLARLTATAEKRANPYHDSKGKFSSGGHGGGESLTGKDAHDSVPAGLYKEGTLTPDETKAVKRYESGWFMVINSGLRHKDLSEADTKTVSQIDSAMDKSVLPKPIETYRGMFAAKLVFGDSFNSDLTGFKWDDLGYGSTTTNKKLAKETFTLNGAEAASERLQGDVVMKVKIPAGVKALQLSTDAKGSKDNGPQSEITLQRKLTWKVVKDHGYTPENIRELEVEVSPISQ
jgi:hypothetical protein